MSARLDRRADPEPHSFHELYSQPSDRWESVNWKRIGAVEELVRDCPYLKLGSGPDAVFQAAELLERDKLKWEINERGVERVAYKRRSADIEPLFPKATWQTT